MIDDAKLDELLALAEKATPGPWCEGAVYGALRMFEKQDMDCMNDACEREGADLWHPCGDETAKLITMLDPATIRQLVQEIQMLRLERNEGREEIKRLIRVGMQLNKELHRAENPEA
jgi:hypothetical protein